MATLDWLEDVDNVEQGQASFTVEGGGKTAIYRLQGVSDPEDIIKAITDVIGGTNIAAGFGTVSRNLQAAHPMVAWLYASEISSLEGKCHDPFTTVAAEPQLEAPALTDQFVLYNTYDFQITFTPRPYAVLSDSSVQPLHGSWYDFGGNLTLYEAFDEWNRFTDYTLEPAFDYITAQQGQMTFRTATTGGGSGSGGSGSGGSGSGATACGPNGKAYAGKPRMPLPNQMLRIVWYAVPYRYVTSTALAGDPSYPGGNYINTAQGCVNQDTLYWPGGTYQPGQLLFLNYKPTKFTPPVQAKAPYASFAGNTVYSTEKLCNIEFNFLYTTRVGTNVPTLPQLWARNEV